MNGDHCLEVAKEEKAALEERLDEALDEAERSNVDINQLQKDLKVEKEEKASLEKRLAEAEAIKVRFQNACIALQGRE